VAAELESYKELSEQLDVIIESSHDGLWISDSEGKVVRVNQASLRFAGLKTEDVIGKSMEEFVAEDRFDRSATLEVLKHGTAVSLVQTQYDGKQLLVTGNPVRDENGDIRLVVVNARDLTTLNRLQAELEESLVLTRQIGSELSQLHKHHDLSSQLIMRCASMLRIFETAMRVSQVDSSVLITGESGVGKGLIAKIIHQASQRQDGPLVRVDCGGIPESLIEAELFGYEKGAFTGALEKGKPGYFELAHGGTLMLDEVGELPFSLQAKLLRFLEDNEVVRIGSTTPRRIDVRIIAVTNRDLEQMVMEGEFRQDLYFRLKVVPLSLPPLRQRIGDIPPLIHHFLGLFNEKCSTDKKISTAAVDSLCRYPFPGNVRELANLIEQLVVLTPGEMVEVSDLPVSVREAQPLTGPSATVDQWRLPEAVQNLEAEMIKRAVRKFGSQREAAKHLGIDHSTICRKIKKYGLSTVEILHRGVVRHHYQ
jgi:PAS domain S-box-containing protein/TyrR family helix-turn-helix protein